MNKNRSRLKNVLIALLVLVIDIWLYQFNMGIFVSLTLVFSCLIVKNMELDYFKVGLVCGLSFMWGLLFWQHLATLVLLVIIYLLLRVTLDRFTEKWAEIMATLIVFLGGSLLFVNFSVFIILVSVLVNLAAYFLLRRLVTDKSENTVINFL